MIRIQAPNHTQMPNDLVDQWIKDLTGLEVKILLVIIRKTFGWHKTRDRISLSQFEKLTGGSRDKISESLQSLIEKGAISKEIEGSLGTEKIFYSLRVHEEEIKEITQEPKATPASSQRLPPPSSKRLPTKETSLTDTKEIVVCSEGAVAPPHQNDFIGTVTKTKANGDQLTISQSEVFAAAVRTKAYQSWKTEEIVEAWNILVEYQGYVNDGIAFIRGTIEKIRNRAKADYAEKMKQKKRGELICQKESTNKNQESSVAVTMGQAYPHLFSPSPT